MKKINIRTRLQKLRTPEFISGAASGILATVMSKAVGEVIQKSLNNQVMGYYFMVVVALVCLILISYFLMRIEKLVENRNYAQFITSKPERLNKMTSCIKNARRSIYILSDLSGIAENQSKEHKKYIKAINQVIADNKGNKGFDVKRIVVPPSTSGINTETDPDWIYELLAKPSYQAYQEHFKQLDDFTETAVKSADGPRNVSVILIDNKHLFWKPELMYGDKALDTLMDGGLYLEDYTLEGIADFAKSFLSMHNRATWVNPNKFYSTKTKTE
jgi:hypothetical protein